MKEDLWPFAGVFQSGLVKRCTHRGNLACLQVPTSWDTKERVPSSGTQSAPDRQRANSGVKFAGSLGAQQVYETHSWIFSHTEGPVDPVTTFKSPVLSTQFTAAAQHEFSNCFHDRNLLKMIITKQALLKYALCKGDGLFQVRQLWNGITEEKGEEVEELEPPGLVGTKGSSGKMETIILHS